jgi:serine/threonine-protein kinase HipA
MRCYGCLKTITGVQQYCTSCKKKLFNEITVKPLNFDKKEFYTFRTATAERISISGVQDKISLKFSQSNILEPTAESGRYILKPIPMSHEIALNVEDMPANEHLCMQISQQIFKLNTAENGLIEFKDGEKAYITKRFDYMKDTAGQTKKADQEDFASILGYSESTHQENYKYDGSYEEIAQGIKKYVAANIPALEEFYKRIVLNYLIGNGDAHLKNFSLIRPVDRDDYILSPNYDLLYTAYHLKSEFGMTGLDLFKEYETQAFSALGYYSMQDFEEFAQLLSINTVRLVKFFKQIIKSEPLVYDLVSNSYMSDKAKESFIVNYKKRLHSCLLYTIDSYSFKNNSILKQSLKGGF